MNTSEEITAAWDQAQEENEKIDNCMDFDTAWDDAHAGVAA